jgi:Holliday junction resolvasome RuvABC endonuclease subunit
MLLGLDISSKATGVAFTSGAHVDTSICLRMPGTDSLIRAVNQYLALDGMLKGVASPPPEFAIIEAYAFRARGRSKHMLYEAGTMLRYSLYSRGIPWFVINPSQLKKFATGYGNAPKPDMILAATNLMGLDTEDDNVADASLLGLMGHCVSSTANDIGSQIELDDTQLEIVKALIPTYQERVLLSRAT